MSSVFGLKLQTTLLISSVVRFMNLILFAINSILTSLYRNTCHVVRVIDTRKAIQKVLTNARRAGLKIDGIDQLQ